MGETLFVLGMVLSGSLLVAGLAVSYLHRVRMERPPIGVFTMGDTMLLASGLCCFPFVFLILPGGVLLVLLGAVIAGMLLLGCRPMLPGRLSWLLPLALCCATIITSLLSGDSEAGAALHWLLNDICMLGCAVFVANLYVQAGMRLRHVACFVLIFALYDAFFAWVFPLTPLLLARFQHAAFVPVFGFIGASYRAYIGLGDLMAFALYACAATKGFGRRGLLTALALIALFGALLPGLLWILLVTRTGQPGAIIPVQAIFGPAAFLGYLWLVRSAPEQSIAAWRRMHRPPEEPLARVQNTSAASEQASA